MCDNVFKFTDIQINKKFEFYIKDLNLAGVVTLPDEVGKYLPNYLIGFKSNNRQFVVNRCTFKKALRLIESRKKHD